MPVRYVYVLLLAGLGCSKPKDPEPLGGIVFWTKQEYVNTLKVDCYVDGSLVGTLSKPMANAPDCDDRDSPHTQVTPGNHTCEFRASNGQRFDIDVLVEANTCYNIQAY